MRVPDTAAATAARNSAPLRTVISAACSTATLLLKAIPETARINQGFINATLWGGDAGVPRWCDQQGHHTRGAQREIVDRTQRLEASASREAEIRRESI